MRLELIWVFLFLTLGLVSSCDQFYSTSRPKNLVSEDMMVDILYDLSIIDGIRQGSSRNDLFEEVLNASYVYIKYGIDSTQLALSDQYYATNPAKYIKIHNRVMLRLEQVEDSIQMAEINNQTR